MTVTGKRSPEPTETSDPKKLKSEPVLAAFHPSVRDPAYKDVLKAEIESSEPYKHGVVPSLFDDSLLRKVREEIMSNIHFTQKETDIYKVFQTGDLANLSGLPEEEQAKLGNLHTLRDALYSKDFRDFLSYVTGCGALSGTKQDLSINLYSKGCHLLNHDDVIGSRRISYILYLPPPDKPWNPRWGGALRLYPTVAPNVPAADFSLVIPPAWNQMAFFTVQPGHSFHDVEEVYVDQERLSISGWFHIPQPGEEGFIPGEQEASAAKSSLQQLQSQALLEYDFPKQVFTSLTAESSEEASGLSEADAGYLAEFMNPFFLTSGQIRKLKDVFLENSKLELPGVLNKQYAAELKKAVLKGEFAKMPMTSGEVRSPWKLAVPPHKCRYLYLDGAEATETGMETVTEAEKDSNKNSSPDFNRLSCATEDECVKTLSSLAARLQSPAFHRWLQLVTSLTPTGEQILVRRFRPGLDFTLATTPNIPEDSGNPRYVPALLEATWNITPTEGWESGELGGYEVGMAAREEEDDDPAVYKGGSNDEEEDPVLFTDQASWNNLTLVLRDANVLKFVKYVSRNAPGSRWDLECKWTVEGEEEEEEEEEGKEEKEETEK